MPKRSYALIDDTFSDFLSHHIRVKVARSSWERQGYFHLRKQTFSREQKILPETETDTKDFRAIPIVALATSWYIGDEIAGAVRIYQHESKPTTWYGGRLCVARRYRGHKRIGKALINEAVSRAIDLGCTEFLATVQPQNETYFQSVHWETIGEIEVAGRPHVHMRAQLEHYPFMERDADITQGGFSEEMDLETLSTQQAGTEKAVITKVSTGKVERNDTQSNDQEYKQQNSQKDIQAQEHQEQELQAQESPAKKLTAGEPI